MLTLSSTDRPILPSAAPLVRFAFTDGGATSETTVGAVLNAVVDADGQVRNGW